jgi:predicted DNA-binding transcriptional regulator AlpA
VSADYLTIDDLAALLKRPRCTLLSDRVRNPGALPPSITLPGTRHILFRRQDVDAWLAQLVAAMPAVPVVSPARRRGRPRKSV